MLAPNCKDSLIIWKIFPQVVRLIELYLDRGPSVYCPDSNFVSLVQPCPSEWSSPSKSFILT